MNEISYWLKQLLIETWITFRSFNIIKKKKVEKIFQPIREVQESIEDSILLLVKEQKFC